MASRFQKFTNAISGNALWDFIKSFVSPSIALIVSAIDWIRDAPLWLVILLPVTVYVIAIVLTGFLQKQFTGKPSKKLPMHRHIMCVIGFIIIAVLGVVINRSTDSRWGTKVPTAVASNIDHSVLIQGNPTGIFNIDNSSKTFNTTDTNALNNALQPLLEKMAKIAKENKAELTNQYPKGYALFTITETKNFFPLAMGTSPIYVNWQNTNYFVEMTKRDITLHLPDTRVGQVYIRGSTVTLPRVVGSKCSIVELTPSTIFEVALISTDTDGVVMVMGPRGTDWK